MGRLFTQTARRKRLTVGQGVTSQYDAKWIYRKKRMPRRMRKRWRGFVRKVHAVAEKDYGTRSYLFNYQTSYGNSTAGSQTVGYAYLYSAYPSGTTGLSADLFRIQQKDNPSGNPSFDSGISVGPGTKFLFQSGILDVTIRNGSTFTADGVTYQAGGTMEVDIYELTLNELAVVASANLSSIQSAFNGYSADAYTPIIGGGSTAANRLDIDKRGATPFDIPLALSRLKIKIWNKRKYIVSYGNAITYQVRDPRRHTLTGEQMLANPGFSIPKMTKVVLIIGKMIPGLTVGSTSGTYQELLYVGATRKYTYKVEGGNDDRAYYDNT